MKKCLVIISLISYLTGALAQSSGSLDMTFGISGCVITDFNNSTESAQSVAIQNDGKIVVAGKYYLNNHFDIGLARYNIDGSIDNTFGTNGKVMGTFGYYINIYGMKIQNDGKIVASGWSGNGVQDNHLVRYNPDGTIDNTFGSGGFVVTPCGSVACNMGQRYAIAIQNDGKILALGQKCIPSTLYAGTILRYNFNGTLDNTFGTNGKVITGLAEDIALQNDGKIIIVGHGNVLRHNSDGSLDSTFEAANIGIAFNATSVTPQSDGKIVVAGSSYNGSNNDFTTVRYNIDGTLDNTFGMSGVVITDINNSYSDVAYSTAIEPDGKIIVGGTSSRFLSDSSSFVVVRYNTDGSLDNTFGVNGKAITLMHSLSMYPMYTAIQGDGKIIAVGTYNNESNDDYVILRYLNCSSPFVIQNPISQTICEGEDMIFTISVTGDDPLTYQWQHNGINILSANNDTLRLNNITLGDAGSYTCIISNSCGSDTSNAGILTFNPLLTPVITGTMPTCPNDSTQLSTGVYANYLWSTGESTQSIYATIADSPVSVTVTDINGCVGSDTIVINYSYTSQGAWTQKANFCGQGFYGEGREGAVGFSIGAKGYIGLGAGWGSETYVDFWEYDPISDSWTQKANFPGPARVGAVGFSIGLKGYVGTGGVLWCAHYKDFWEYDPINNIWTQKADFGGTVRWQAVGFSIGSKGYIGTGSVNHNAPYYKDFWEYDPVNDTWTQKADFGGTARRAAVGFSIGSKGYIGAGAMTLWPPNILYKDFWGYDPASDTWTQKADIGGTEKDGAVGFSIGNKGYIGTGSYGGAKKDLWEYDPNIGTWKQMTDFGGTERISAVGFSIGTKGYIGTGCSQGYSPKYRVDFWEFDPCPAPTITTQPANQAACEGSSVSFTVTAIGDSTLMFQWQHNGTNISGATNDTLLLTNITLSDTGSYTCYISNCCGSIMSNAADLKVNSLPSLSITSTNLSCTGSGDGTAIVTASGGTPSYSYLWNTIPVQNTQTATCLAAGNYMVTVTDANGCFASSSGVITEPSLLIASITATNVSCFGGNDGSATVIASGGTSPYTYLWNTAPPQTDLTANGLSAGSYMVTVTDANNCVVSDTVGNSVQTILWQKSFGGSNYDGESVKIQHTFDGGYILSGTSESNNGDVTGHHGSTNYADYWVVKLNATGVLEWQKSLGGSNGDNARSITQTIDGGFIVSGVSISNDGDVSGNHGGADYWIVKLTTTGTIQWQKTYGGSNYDYAQSIQQTSDKGYIIAGGSFSNNGNVTGHHGSTAFSDYWIVKIDSAGNLQWQKSLGGSILDAASSIQQTSDGGYIVAGTSESIDGDVSGNHGMRDNWLVRLNNAGSILWQKPLGGSSIDEAASILQTSDDGFIVAGVTQSNDGDVSGNNGDNDCWVVKLNSNGVIQWQKSLGGILFDAAGSIKQTSDEGYILAGVSNSNDGDVTGNHGNKDYWVVKLGTSGELLWQKSIGGSNDDVANSIVQTIDGGYTVAGWSQSIDGDVIGNHGNADYWVVKLITVLTVTITQPSEIIVNINTSICQGDSIFLSGAHQTISGIYYDTLQAANGCDSIIITTLNVNQLPIAEAGTNQTVCAGASVTLIATGGTSYQWNNGVINGVPFTPASTNNYSVTVTNANGCSATDEVSVTVNPNLPVSVNISSNPSGAICLGNSVTYTAIPTNGGATPSYQWQENGINVGTNSTTYTSSTLTNGSITTCIMTSNASCITGNPDTSNALTIQVNIAPSITANPLDVSVCSGNNATFNVAATGTGLSYAWQMSSNGGVTFSNITSAGINPAYSNWTSSALGLTGIVSGNNGFQYRCIITGTCSPQDTSNLALLTVNQTLPVSVSIYATYDTICAGMAVTFFANSNNSGPLPIYQWYVNTNPVGTNSPLYTSSTLTNGAVVTCDLTSNAGCASSNPASSNSITMTVNPNLPVSVNISANPAGPICSGTSVTFTAIATNGGTSPSYQWQVNGINVGTNSPTFTGSTLTNGNIVTCKLTSNASCATSNPATSNFIIMTVNSNLPVSVNVSANPSGQVCLGTSVTFIATLTNGGSSPSYQWQVNGTNAGNNSPNFTSSTLTNSNTVRCIITSNAVCATGNPDTSNSITMVVLPNLPVSVIISANPIGPICAGTSVIFNATATNGGSLPSYQWKVNGTTVGANSSTFTSSTLTNNSQVICIITSNTTCSTGNPANSNTITTTVLNNLPVSVNISANPAGSICSGTSVTFIATPANGGTSPSYQWQVNGINVGTNSSIFTSSTLTNGSSVTCILSSNAICPSSNPDTSNILTMTVNPLPVPLISGSLTYCAGTQTTLSTLLNYTGYLWSTGAVTATIHADTSNYPVIVTVSDSNGCHGVSAPVNLIETNTLSPVISGILNYCQGNSTTLSAGIYSNYIWSTGANTQSIIADTSDNPITVTVTDLNGCAGISPPVNVIVIPGPLPVISGNYSYCQGTNTNLSTGSFNTYLWSTGETTSAIIATVASNPITVTVTAANGCIGVSDTVILSEEQISSVNITATPDSVCTGQSTQLTASGGIDYVWSNGDTLNTIVVTPITATNYSVTATGVGCSGSANIMISVTPSMTVIVNPAIICSGETTSLTASPGTDYFWSTGDTVQTITVAPLINTTYNVTVTNSGCSASASAEVITNPLPNAHACCDTSVCHGIKTTLTASGGGNYLWSYHNLNTSDIVVCPVNTTTYFVTVTNPVTGCFSVDSVEVYIYPYPNIIAEPDTTICHGQSAQLLASGGIAYSWSPQLDLSCNDCSDPIATPQMTQSYCVVGTDINGCTKAANLLIIVDVPPTPIIEHIGNILSSNYSSGNQWYKNGVIIPGATDTIFAFTTNGCYSVIATDSIGCVSDTSNIICIGDVGIMQNQEGSGIKIYPNPTSDIINIEIQQTFINKEAMIYLYDIQGQLLFNKPIEEVITVIDISIFAKAMYVLKIRNSGNTVIKKIIKE